MTKSFYKCDSFNFVPLTRTPWAGTQIATLKNKYFSKDSSFIPSKIGESWEVSTDAQFPSQIHITANQAVPLPQFLAQHAIELVGKEMFSRYGAHFPVLLKWLEASDVLSVQLHPDNSNAMLKANECGKPEAWLVMNVENEGFVYLGFKEGLSHEEILRHLKNDAPEKCLHKYYPKQYDYISVPPGCVHAVGPGVLVAEPQYVLPQKIAKTWRLSDWNRLYDVHGIKSPTGNPRELHTQESLPAINWQLPQGIALEKMLIQSVCHAQAFKGNHNNPFALQIFNAVGEFDYCHLKEGAFSLFTVISGEVTISTAHDSLVLHGGESGFVCANTPQVSVICKEGLEAPCVAFFALCDDLLK